jgi:hypothetical protein
MVIPGGCKRGFATRGTIFILFSAGSAAPFMAREAHDKAGQATLYRHPETVLPHR